MNKIIAAIAITAASLAATAAIAETAVTESRAKISAIWDGRPVYAGPDLSGVEVRSGATPTTVTPSRSVDTFLGTITFGPADPRAVDTNRRFGRTGAQVSR